MMNPMQMLGLIFMMTSAATGTLYYDGGGADPANWHNPVNWVGNVLPGSADAVEINQNQGYSGAINTTSAVSVAAFTFKNIQSTLTIGAGFTSAERFSIEANNGRASVVNVTNAGTTVSSAEWSNFGRSTAPGNAYWRVTLGDGTVWNAGAHLMMLTSTNSVNYCELAIHNAVMNIGSYLKMTEDGTSELRLNFQDWNGQINVLGISVTNQLGGRLIISGDFAATNTQYNLIRCSSTHALTGGFENVTFGSTMCMNNVGDLYRLDLAALDGDGVSNDVVLNRIPALDIGNIHMVDEEADTNTVAFYANLMKLTDAPCFAFGQHGATHQGVGWSGTSPYDRTDIYDVIAGLNGGTGDYPAVDGYDIQWVLNYTVQPGNENPKPAYPEEPLYSVTLSSTNAQRVSGEIQAAYARGSMITFFAPLNNPDAEAGGNCTDLTNPHPERGSLINRCLPAGYGTNAVDGDLFPAYQGSLDSFAQLIHGDAGLGLENLGHIPVLFRPWHEWNFKNMFWWGTNQCSGSEYIAMWQFTVDYLRDVKGLHNLIYVWAPSINVAGAAGDAAAAEANYFSRWPGDDYVDVLGGDCYYTLASGGYSNLTELLPVMIANGAAKNKAVALSEIGSSGGLPLFGTNRFWNANFLQPLLRDLGLSASRIAYAMTWLNNGPYYYFSSWPQSGVQEHELEFFDFWQEPAVLFQSSLPDLYAGSTFSFSPADDAFVWASNPDTNYGSTTLLKVRTNNQYRSFLKFNVTGIPEDKTVVAARLKLWSQNVDQDVTVYTVADTNWMEGTVTWNSQPAMGSELKTLRVFTNSPAVFNLSGAVTGNGVISFGLQGSGSVMNQFYSKETGTVSLRPQLELVVVDAPGSD